MRQQQGPTTIAILGANTVVEHALALLLEGVGYDAKILEEPATGLANGLLDGVDVLLLVPDLSAESREVFLGGLGSTAHTARIPVLVLSPTLKGAVLGDEEHVYVPWPSRIEDLARKIEAALASARSSNEQGALSICGLRTTTMLLSFRE